MALSPASLFSADVQAILDAARDRGTAPALTASPADWRDQWIYFLMIDRFNNPAGRRAISVRRSAFARFQGGTFRGVPAAAPLS